ncbi:class I SAM-dependent methyltransferase [Streptomyces sp. NPDC000888]
MPDSVRAKYYEHRAPVYDATSYRGNPETDAGLDLETAEIGDLLPRSLPPDGQLLEVGCGTGVWTQFLPGRVTAMDQSQGMLDIARTRAPHAQLVRAAFPPLPFPDDAFDLVFAANFYGLLVADERDAFLAEASRVARGLVILDLRSDSHTHMEGLEHREVDGVPYPIFRRRFTPSSLLAELGGDVLYPGRYFLVVRAPLRKD